MEMVRFQDMPYVRPDMEALKAAYQETIEKLKSAASYEEARSAFFALQGGPRWPCSAPCATPSTPPTPTTTAR